MKVWFDCVTMRDAVLLRKWWNNHTFAHHYIVPSKTNPRFCALVRANAS